MVANLLNRRCDGEQASLKRKSPVCFFSTALAEPFRQFRLKEKPANGGCKGSDVSRRGQ